MRTVSAHTTVAACVALLDAQPCASRATLRLCGATTWPPSRAKLLRFAVSVHTGEREWKERGTGELKLLRHKTHNKIRLLTRQDKTLKICANHVVEPSQPLVRPPLSPTVRPRLLDCTCAYVRRIR